ncbi:MAG: hypothetical protein JWO31_1098 [Phycisphaerales bacterium]|nr:hypothetical protein [Phycisphaerales bacterium]
MRSSLKTLFVAAYGLVLLVGSTALMGCNTTEGVGKDVKSTGEAIKDTAHDAKN